MDKEFIECLKKCNTYEDVVELVDEVIEDEIEISKSNNRYSFIGCDSMSNTKKIFLGEPKKFEFLYNSGWNGFIDSNIRVTFGAIYNLINGEVDFKGRFYYVDTREFIYDFCYKYKDFDFEDEFDLICFVKLSMDEYFNSITCLNDVSREDMVLPICKDNDTDFDIMHKFSDFKGRNNAMCTERAVFANNLLSVYGLGVCMALGNIVVNGKDEGHAYNFVDIGDGLSLVDFSVGTDLYNLTNDKVMTFPFVHDMGEDKTRLDEFAETSEKIHCPSYINIIYGDDLYMFYIDKERIYNIGNFIPVKQAEPPKILLKGGFKEVK